MWMVAGSWRVNNRAAVLSDSSRSPGDSTVPDKGCQLLNERPASAEDQVPFVSEDPGGGGEGVDRSVRPPARNHVRQTKTAKHMFQKVSIAFLVEQELEPFGCRTNLSSPTKPVTGKISQPFRAFDSFIVLGPGSRRRVTAKGNLAWMNAFIAGHVVAIRAWWRRNLQSAARNVAIARAPARNGNSFSCYSVADFLSVPAPAIPTTTAADRTVITGTATATAASKRKPSIVRVVRVRRRP